MYLNTTYFQNKQNGKFFDWSIHNEQTLKQERRLRKVVLLYRRSGDWTGTWHEGALENRVESRLLNIVDGVIDFSTDGVEDDRGYAALHWNLSNVGDGAYQVKVQSQCNTESMSDPQQEHAAHNTEAIEFIVDREAPIVYGIPDLQLVGKADHVKHQEFVIPFTEALFCGMPHTFALSVTLSSGDDNKHGFSHGNGIFVMCEGKEIRFRFSTDKLKTVSPMHLPLTDEINVKIDLEGVQDLARNTMEPFQHESGWDRQATHSPSR